jgi:hypothetical protein
MPFRQVESLSPYAYPCPLSLSPFAPVGVSEAGHGHGHVYAYGKNLSLRQLTERQWALPAASGGPERLAVDDLSGARPRAGQILSQ